MSPQIHATFGGRGNARASVRLQASEDWRVYPHGWQSWSPSPSLNLTDVDIRAPAPMPASGPSAPPKTGLFASEEVAALASPVRRGRMFIGAVSPRGTLATVASCSDIELARYAAHIAKEPGARMPERTPTGWCSWSYYFTSVTEAALLVPTTRS